MKDSLCGIRSPCYGEYKCVRCYRRWASSVAWRYEGQECKHCNDPRTKPEPDEPNKKPNEPLLYFYSCPKEDCGLKWKSPKGPESQCKACQTPGVMLSQKGRREYMLAHYLARDVPRTTEEKEYELPNFHVAFETHLCRLCERCEKSPLKNCQQQLNADILAAAQRRAQTLEDWEA